MEGSEKGTSKDAVSNFEKLQADFAAYLRHKYFSGKDIDGEEIFQEVAIGGMTIKSSRLPPTSSYEDPVAYRKAVAALRVEAEKSRYSFAGAEAEKTRYSSRPRSGLNLLADVVDQEYRIPTLKYHVGPARNQVVDTSDDSSDSLQEISADAWNEVQSAIKQAQSEAGPSNRRP